MRAIPCFYHRPTTPHLSLRPLVRMGQFVTLRDLELWSLDIRVAWRNWNTLNMNFLWPITDKLQLKAAMALTHPDGQRSVDLVLTFSCASYRRGSNLVCYSRPKVYTYPQNFIWMCSLSRLPVAKNHNFGQIWTFLGAPVPTPFYPWEPNLVCYSTPTTYAYLPNFVSIGLFCRPLAAKWTGI